MRRVAGRVGLLRSRRRSGFTLVEVIVAAGILTIALLGVMSSFMIIQRSERMTREQTAAVFAAQSMIEEISTYARLNPADLVSPPDPCPFQLQFDNMGFDVFFGSYQNGDGGIIGSGRDATGGVNATGSVLKPGDPSLFPSQRTLEPAPEQLMAGYVTVKRMNPQDTLFDVDVIVAWKSYGGDQRVVYSAIIGPLK
jgi:prepilin-type N-terminal cleavage/methylation domain-containing protein